LSGLAARFLTSSTLFSNPRSNSATVIPSAREIIISVRIVVFFNPRSILPTKVRCRPERAAKSSWLLFHRVNVGAMVKGIDKAVERLRKG